MNVIKFFKRSVSAVKGFISDSRSWLTGVGVSVISLSAFADVTAPNPSTVITADMLSKISTPILVTIGSILTAAFGILTLKLVSTIGMGLVKSLFSKASG